MQIDGIDTTITAFSQACIQGIDSIEQDKPVEIQMSGRICRLFAGRNGLDVDTRSIPSRFFILREDLIKSKRASGQPQDLIDADLLSQSPDPH
jgi:hypothetical protein